jgi:hypothetical protein
MGSADAEMSLAVVAENLLLLPAVEVDGRPWRRFSIMHMRFSDHDHRLHKYTIEAGHGMLMRGEALAGSAQARSAQSDAASTCDQDGRSGSRGSLT